MKFKYRPCETTRITSPYGYRPNPLNPSKQQFHTGVDISPKDKIKYFEEPIFAVADGKVTLAGFNTARGNQILIDHEENTDTRSQHLAKMVVKTGQQVIAGQIIGYMGSTGDSTGQHLHFEVIINGKTVNPATYIQGLPMPKQHSELYKKVQQKYGFQDETMEYLESYQYAESLFTKMLIPAAEQNYQLSTIQYVLNYKYGKEVFTKLAK